MSSGSVASGQSFSAEAFRPEDAVGIVELFRVVYGDAYPLARYYDPGWIIKANASGELISVVSRTPGGGVVAHSALYRSSPDNPGLLELGLGLTLPEYRTTFAMIGITFYLRDVLLPGLNCDGIFGEAVCNHVTTQKLCSFVGMTECALELDLMPSEAYSAEQSADGRVSCLNLFRQITERERPLYLPDSCRSFLDDLLPLLKIKRELATADTHPQTVSTQAETSFFDFAGVSRCNLIAAGQDYADVLAEMEQHAVTKGRHVSQVFINLADRANGGAVEWLRSEGYFPGGVLPCWFVNGDALLLQKLEKPPVIEQIKLQSAQAKRLLELVQREYAS